MTCPSLSKSSAFSAEPAAPWAAEARSRTEHRSLEVLFGQRQPWSFIIPADASNPEASSRMHNLDRIDASREWLAIILRVPALVCTPHVDEITELLDAVRDAALEEAVRLEVGVVSLDLLRGLCLNGAIGV